MDTPIVGTDGQRPLRDLTRGWHMFGLHELYMGDIGAKKYIPNVNDYAKRIQDGVEFCVVSVDPITFIPELKLVRKFGDTDISQEDILFPTLPGAELETFRCVIDKNQYPYQVNIDPFLVVRGTQVTHVKVFRGDQTDLNGDAISRVYDGNGTFLTELVPLEMADIDGHTNYATKVIPPFYTLADLQDNERVTVVHYNSSGVPISRRQLIVQSSAFVRSANITRRYIDHIALKSPYLSDSDANTLNAPIGFPLSSMNLEAEIHYTDGVITTLPIDGTRFELGGVEQLMTAVPGQESYVTLRYHLSNDEMALSGLGPSGRTMQRDYKLVVTNPNNSVAVKLFAFPYWVDAVNGYRLKFFLYNLDRNVWFDVTSAVKFHMATGPFNPLLFGILQRKKVYLNLSQVSQAFPDYTHVQVMDIFLVGSPVNTPTPWTIVQSVGSNKPTFGIDCHATRVSSTQVNLSSGKGTLAAWREAMYYNNDPMVNGNIEQVAPQPTHFVVAYADQEVRLPMSAWSTNITLNAVVVRYQNLYVRFVKHTSTGDLELGVTGLVIK